MILKVRLRARINGRLPDPDGKFRDEVTQEIEIEVDGAYRARSLDELVAIAETELDKGIERALLKLAAFGGMPYSLPPLPIPIEVSETVP